MAADNGDLDVEQLRWTAVLHCGRTAALCAWTALEEHGLRGFERTDGHVVVRRATGTAPPPRPLPLGADGVRRRVRVHESRRHSADDVRRAGGAPRHAPARAAVDAASWGPSGRAAAGVLAATAQQRWARPPELLEVIGGAGAIARRRWMTAVVHDVSGGSQALSELDLLRLCRTAGLPEPQRPRRRRDVDGRLRHLDAERVRSDGRGVVVEVDGRGHLDVARWEDDLLRANDVTLGDRALVLRKPATLLRTAPDLVMAQLRRALTPQVPVTARRREDDLWR